METQQQFEFCHRVLEEVLWGRGAGQEDVDGDDRKRGRRLFGGWRKRDGEWRESHCMTLMIDNTKSFISCFCLF